MKKFKYIAIVFAGLVFVLSSCLDDLNTRPLDGNEFTSADVFDDPDSYEMFLAKIYAGLSLSGQQGPAGSGDIAGIDEGFSQYIRGYFKHQVLSTDEAVIGWDDQTIKDFIYHAWTPSDVFVAAMYYRLFFQISLVNEYLRETTDAKLDERNVSGDLRAKVELFREEARFLRALSYYHALDLFGNVPFVTEDDGIGAFLPEQIERADLFDFLESELLELEDVLVAPGQNEYGRVDRATAWMVLAKMYLNAEVYTGQARYDKALEYAAKIIDQGGYSIHDNYHELFMADNNKIQNPDLNEIIFAVRHDGIHTQSYGGTTFILNASIGGAMDAEASGTSESWGGLRTTRALVELFGENDGRALFFTDGQTLDIEDLGNFEDGYAVVKFTNMRSDGTPGSNSNFADTDFPMFRLADAYLMYAEAHLRGGGGDASTALALVNELRERAYGDDSGNIAASALTLDFIINERGRELYWEAHRRTDLVRFGMFSGGDYLWPWKGNTPEGNATNARYDIYPLPFSDTSANPNLTQNQGYN